MQIAKHSYAVTGLGAAPPWVVNAGFIVGEKQTLIVDTGANWLAAQTIHGYARAIRPNNQIIVFNCEPHFDHIGGNSYFDDLGIALYGHHKIVRTAAQFDGEKDDYNAAITNPARASSRETEAFFANTRLVNPTNKLVAGDRLDLGSVEIEILATPGHTAINQAVYNKTDNVLYCADCIVTDYIANLEASSAVDWHDWRMSLTKIERLAPEVIMPGHGRVLRGQDEISAEIQRMRDTLDRAIGTGHAPTV